MGDVRTYEDGLRDGAKVCKDAASVLISNGRARVNQVDRHTADVLCNMERKILALAVTPADPPP